MGLFDRIPASFGPGALWQLASGGRVRPAGKSATSGQFLKKNSAGDWDGASLASTDMSDFNEAAQDAAGLMVANSAKVSLTYVDATPSLTADIIAGSLGPADIANRTRRIPCFLYDFTNGVAVPQSDGHGSLGGLPHWHLPDAATTYLFPLMAVPLPTDYVAGTVTLKYAWASTAAGNNVRFDRQAYAEADAATVVAVLHTAQATVAAAAAANTMTFTSQALASNPATDTIVLPVLGRIGGDAADTNTGTVCIYSVWLEYTADS